MLLHDLVSTWRTVAGTTRRKEKIARLADLLRRTDPDFLPTVVPFLVGRLRQGRIGVGWALLRDARSGSAPDEPTLEVRDADRTFAEIAGLRGPGSTAAKGRALHALLSRATEDERAFVTRLLMGELRQGALEGIMIDAVARAAGAPTAVVRRALMVAGELAPVAHAALARGTDGLAQFGMRLLRPVQPMLAQTAEDVGAALDTLGEAALEFKLDGARIQIHKQGDQVRVFSRRLKGVTAAVPEIVRAVAALPVASLIADGEVIALNPDGTPRPFQTTARRFGRKLDLDRMVQEVPLTPYLFDLLQLDGADLFDEPQASRWNALADVAAGDLLVPAIVVGDRASAEQFFAQALASGHEGIMAKARDAAYEAGGRGKSWLKVKHAHTLDLVVLAAEWGHGRREGWLSNLHLGVRDPAGGFVMLGKTFKGLTDEMLRWQTERLLGLEVSRDGWTVYVRPELVVEVAFNDVQASPHYPAGMALRFARVRRFRTDKPATEADTIAAVRRIHATDSV